MYYSADVYMTLDGSATNSDSDAPTQEFQPDDGWAADVADAVLERSAFSRRHFLHFARQLPRPGHEADGALSFGLSETA